MSELDSECKILMCSYIPMMHDFGKSLSLKPRRKVRNSLQETDREKVEQELRDKALVSMNGIKANDYAVSNWKEYYELSLKHAESGVKHAKEQWFNNTHKQWQLHNKCNLEPAHIGAELLSQKRDPRHTA